MFPFILNRSYLNTNYQSTKFKTQPSVTKKVIRSLSFTINSPFRSPNSLTIIFNSFSSPSRPRFSKSLYQYSHHTHIIIPITPTMSLVDLHALFCAHLQNSNHDSLGQAHLAEEQFMRTYRSDPFFKERINVEIQKFEGRMGQRVKKMRERHLQVENQEDLEGTSTLKEMNSHINERDMQRCLKYIELVRQCK